MSNNGPVGWPTATADPWPPSPQNTHPQKFHGLPQGVDRNASEAEALLATAVGWWDCSSGFKQGDRFLRNKGTGQDYLDLRLGSSTSANSNDPQFLPVEEQGYVYLPGVVSNYMSVPDSADLDIVGDIDIRVRVALDDWTPAAANVLACKADDGTSQYSFLLYIGTDGKPVFWWSTAGTSATRTTKTSSAATGLTDGSTKWVRVTLDVDNGASGSDVKFWLSDDNVTYTQLGTTQTTAGVTSVWAGTRPFEFGAQVGNTPLAGKAYRAIVKSGIDGTTVLDIDCDAITSGSQESFLAKTGQMVSIYRATSGRKAVAMPSRVNGGRSCFLFGTDDYFAIPSTRGEQHALLNFGAGDSFTALAVVRQWATPVNQSPMISKGSWQVYNDSTNARLLAQVTDGTNTVTCAANSFTVGESYLSALVVDRAAQTARSFVNATPTATSSISAVGSLANAQSLYIGVQNTYLTGEGIAFAVFRRALTTREINLINDYYTKTPYVPMPTDADRKAYLSAKLGTSDDAVLSILKDAVWHVDAQAFRAGSSHAENLGWGGPTLNARLGSAVAGDSNDPRHLAPEASGYVYLPGIAGNYLSVPDEAALDIVGDIDIRVKVALDDWTPATIQNLAGKRGAAGTRSWRFAVMTTGYLSFVASTDGTAEDIVGTSGAAVGAADGATKWVRVTRATTAGENKYWTSDDGVTWIQLGSTVTVGAGSGIFSSTSIVEIGTRDTGASEPSAGKFYRAIVKNGIDGTTVLDVNCDALTDGRQTSFYATTGQLVSISRATAGRKSVVVPNTTNKKMDDAHLYLPGVAGNYASVPDEAALDITGDLDLRAWIAADDYSVATGPVLFSKWLATGSQRSFLFYLSATGVPAVLTSANGSATAKTFTSSAALPVPDGSGIWVRAAVDVDDGAGNAACIFYTSPDGVSWTQLGTTQTSAGTTSIYAGTAELRIGGPHTTEAGLLAGRYYKAQVYNGIAGTKVLDIDFADADAAFVPGSASSFTCTTGQTVTLNSTASSGMAVKDEKWGVGRSCWLFGTDDYMETPDSALLDFEGGESFTVLAVAREFGTVVNGGRYVSKYSADPGWVLAGASATVRQMYLSGLATAQTTVTGRVAGVVYALVGVRDKSLSLANIFANGVQGTPVPDSSYSLANSGVMRVGRDSASGANYNDMEFVAAAVFRRALTPGEIATLNTYFNV